MSDWVIEKEYKRESTPVNSDWTVAPEISSSEKNPMQNESLGMSALKAPFRVTEDLYKGLFQFLKGVPEYYESAKTEIPGLMGAIQNDPKHSGGQGLAGLAELGQNLFNIPHDLVNYASQRLNLIPQNINQQVQMGRMPADTQQMIDKTFGQPTQPGEEFLRGLGRNLPTVLAGGGIAKAFNPMNLTARNVAKSIVQEGDKQMVVHNKFYKKLWKDAESSGINTVPVNKNIINENIEFIKKYKSPKDYTALETFNEANNLPNAQKAVSDIKGMTRALDKKSRTSSLTDEEKKLYDALENTKNHIESNMFRNKDGTINNNLATRYRAISNSYRENVVPYKYNKDIQAFKEKEIVAKQLAERLKTGEFGAKKGSKHPELYRADALKNLLIGLGAGSGFVGGTLGLYKYLSGKDE